MKFLCLAYGDEDGWNSLSESEQQEVLAQDEVIREWSRFGLSQTGGRREIARKIEDAKITNGGIVIARYWQPGKDI